MLDEVADRALLRVDAPLHPRVVVGALGPSRGLDDALLLADARRELPHLVRVRIRVRVRVRVSVRVSVRVRVRGRD